MSKSQPFKSLPALAASLQEQIQMLLDGRLSREELEALTEVSRELYERLIVLRHKAFDESVKQPAAEVETPEVSEMTFRVSLDQPEEPVPSKQVSLIDAIEEITREEEIPSAPAEPQPESGAPLFLAAAPASAPVEFTATPAATPVAAESLNDRLSKSIPAQESLARKLENTPIADLKRAITLNQRFQFSRELFRGNNQDYEVTIDRLNTTTRDEAMKTLENLKSRYSWSEESAVAQDFRELVERRHQA
jgi:hypothetical protein